MQADETAIDRSREMLTQITGMCDEAEYMLHQNELNYAEAMAFADQVVLLANVMRANIARQMEEPDRDKLPPDLKNLPVAMIKEGLKKIALPYTESIRHVPRVIHVDTSGLVPDDMEYVWAYIHGMKEGWKGWTTEQKQKAINDVILQVREKRNGTAKAV